MPIIHICIMGKRDCPLAPMTHSSIPKDIRENIVTIFPDRGAVDGIRDHL